MAKKMKTFFLRSMLTLSLGLAGIYSGAWTGATFFLPEGTGLAGGAMILGYMVLGFVLFAIVGAIIAFRLRGHLLRKAVLVISMPILLVYMLAGIRWIWNNHAEQESDSAYAPAGDFNIAMERLDLSDPYLYTRIEVDSRTRTWTQTGPGPEHRICSAHVGAKNLIAIRTALETMLTASKNALPTECDPAQGPAVKQLIWKLRDEPHLRDNLQQLAQGVLKVNAACLKQHTNIARAFASVENVSRITDGKVSCK